MTSRTPFFPIRPDRLSAFTVPLLRQFWVIVLIGTVGVLSTLAFGRMQAPSYEVSAVVLVGPGGNIAAAKALVTSRSSLLALQHRQQIATGESADRVAVRLRQLIAVKELTSQAGSTLGLQPEVSGIVISALWSDPETSARIAKDLAQQILDAPAPVNWTHIRGSWISTAGKSSAYGRRSARCRPSWMRSRPRVVPKRGRGARPKVAVWH